MRKIAQELLDKHLSFIDALKEAVERWERSTDVEDKRLYIGVIGYIGNEIHKMNRSRGIK